MGCCQLEACFRFAVAAAAMTEWGLRCVTLVPVSAPFGFSRPSDARARSTLWEATADRASKQHSKRDGGPGSALHHSCFPSMAVQTKYRINDLLTPARTDPGIKKSLDTNRTIKLRKCLCMKLRERHGRPGGNLILFPSPWYIVLAGGRWI